MEMVLQQQVGGKMRPTERLHASYTVENPWERCGRMPSQLENHPKVIYSLHTLYSLVIWCLRIAGEEACSRENTSNCKVKYGFITVNTSVRSLEKCNDDPRPQGRLELLPRPPPSIATAKSLLLYS